jgi:hypothetical protein
MARRLSKLWQLNRAFSWLRVLSVEQRGVPDGPDKDAPAFVGDFGGEFVTLGSFDAEKTQLHELVRAQPPIQLDEKSRSQSTFAELKRWCEFLAETAQM